MTLEMDQLSSDLASLKISRDVPASPSLFRRLGVVLSLIVVLLGIGYVLLTKLSPRIFKVEVNVTQVMTISPVQASVQVTSTGYVIPQVWSKVGAKVQGRLAEVFIREGDAVKAGMVIARISDDDQKSAVAAARTRVLMARARTETARANLAEIQRQVERTRSLVAEKAMPRAQLEDLELRAAALAEMVSVAKAETVAAEAEENTLRVGLKDREITSPISGTVISKPSAVGETVGLEIPIAEIADFNSIVVETDVPESRLHLVKAGTPCEIVLDAYPTRRFRGVTSEIGKRINRAKATVVAKVKFRDSTEGILPDMSARVSFLTEEIEEKSLQEKPKKVVAATAVAERDGHQVLFVVEDGKVHVRTASVGAVIGSNVELLDDILPGTRVVRNPSGDLYNGQRVKEQEN